MTADATATGRARRPRGRAPEKKPPDDATGAPDPPKRRPPTNEAVRRSRGAGRRPGDGARAPGSPPEPPGPRPPPGGVRGSRHQGDRETVRYRDSLQNARRLKHGEAGARGQPDPVETRHSHLEATLALHVHEEGVGGLHQPLALVPPRLQLLGRVEQVNVVRENLRCRQSSAGVRRKRGGGRTRRAGAAGGLGTPRPPGPAPLAGENSPLCLSPDQPHKVPKREVDGVPARTSARAAVLTDARNTGQSTLAAGRPCGCVAAPLSTGFVAWPDRR